MGSQFSSASSAPSSGAGKARRPAYAVAGFVFVTVAAIAGTLSYFGGYVSPDSSNYLQLAEQIAHTGDFRHGAAWGTGAPQLMTVWPLGYPTLVAAVAALGLDTLTASKVLAIALLGGSLGVVLRLFGSHTRTLTLLVFALPSCVRIHTYSWSEQLFIFGLLLAVLCAQKVRHDHRWWPALAVAMSVVFCTRYIGAFLPITVFALALAWRSLPQRRWLLLAAVVALAFDAAYLLNNFSIAGHVTGTERIPAPESLPTLAVGFVRSVALDAGPFALLVGTVAWTAWQRPRAWLAEQIDARPDAVMAVVVGAGYLGALFALRSVRHFDFFNPRLTFPGVALVLVGLSQLAPTLLPPAASVWLQGVRRATIAATILYLGIWTGSHVRALDTSTSALAKAEDVVSRYATLAPHTILIAPDAKHGHLEYPQRLLRPDLVIVEPKSAPYFTPESAVAFAARLRSIQRAYPSSSCVLDLTGVDDLSAYQSSLRRSGVLDDTVQWLTREAHPGQLLTIEGCGGTSGPAGQPTNPAGTYTRSSQSLSTRLQPAFGSSDAAQRVRRPDSRIAQSTHP